MKKITGIGLAALFLSLALVSCQNNVESDAKKIAGLLCEAQNLGKKAMNGDQSIIDQAKKLKDESEKLMKEMENKYTSASDKEKLRAAMVKELANCK